MTEVCRTGKGQLLRKVGREILQCEYCSGEKDTMRQGGRIEWELRQRKEGMQGYKREWGGNSM